MESHLPNDPDGSDPVGRPAFSGVLARLEALGGHTKVDHSDVSSEKLCEEF